MIVPPFDHDSFIAIAVFTLTDHFPIAVAITMAATNGNAYARRADSNAYPDIFRTRRHRNRNSSHRDGSHHNTLDHLLLLSMKLLEDNM
jgi:predicted ATPase